MNGTPINLHYNEQAVGIFSCNAQNIVKKQDQDKLKQQRVTIESNLIFRLIGNNFIELEIDKLSSASLATQAISNSWDRGSFIDIFSSSINPCKLDNNSFPQSVDDSIPTTEVKEFGMEVEQTNKKGAEVNLSSGVGKDFENGIEYGAQMSTSCKSSCRTKEKEFKILKRLDDRKKIVQYILEYCKNQNGFYVRYNTHDMSTFKESNVGVRVGVGIIPVIGWFGLFAAFPDTLNNPPSCSTSSLQFPNWITKFSFQPNAKLKFEWTIVVRTVFASISGLDSCNWIKTVHKIKKIFTINTVEGILEEEDPEITKLCIIGSGSKDSKLFDISDKGNPKQISNEERSIMYEDNRFSEML